VRGYRGRGVTALRQRKGRAGDRVSHQVTNDDDARHVVTTSIPKLGWRRAPAVPTRKGQRIKT
jgi:hypothetical protein